MALSDPSPSFLTPEFIRSIRFTRLRRGGYDIQEVDSFLLRFAEFLESDSSGVQANETEDADLYDPEGAAQRLLAAAQRTADSLTKEAATQAEQLIASAEAQADNIKRVVVEEARKMAEESQVELRERLEDLDSKRKHLENMCGFLEGQLNAGKDQMLTVVDEMRKTIEDSEFEFPTLEEEMDGLEKDPSGLEKQMMTDSDDSYRGGEPSQQDTVFVVSEIRDIGVGGQGDSVEVLEDQIEEGVPPELSLVHSTQDLESWIDAAAAGAEEGISKLLSEDEEDTGPPTQISPVVQDGEGVSGDRFFEELRDSDPHESVLGLVDEETDAAISSFLSDEE